MRIFGDILDSFNHWIHEDLISELKEYKKMIFKMKQIKVKKKRKKHYQHLRKQLSGITKKKF